jgi:hypothetical protein
MAVTRWLLLVPCAIVVALLFPLPVELAEGLAGVPVREPVSFFPIWFVRAFVVVVTGYWIAPSHKIAVAAALSICCLAISTPIGAGVVEPPGVFAWACAGALAGVVVAAGLIAMRQRRASRPTIL